MAPHLGVTAEWLRGSREGARRAAATPAELTFAAVEEAFLIAAFPPDLARVVAAEIQVIVSAHPPVPPGMKQTDVVRRWVRYQLADKFPPKDHS